MTKKNFLFLLPVLLCWACQSKKDTPAATISNDSIVNSSTTAVAVEDSVKITGQPLGDSTYTYIKDVIKKGDSLFIQADYIQFFTGDEAIKQAELHHAADTSRDDKGKITSISVDDDYYLLNESKKLRLLPISKDVSIQTVDMSASVQLVSTTLADFVSKHAKYTFPYIIWLQNNQVVKIEEVFVP